ncbi:hypothetical protein N658DRAFT_6659 [Parathielavia hyrcaniae]|uniref:Uncharacterized protein n=1 Tax=Parathielavia hyrcaniae TaxID=113614 RepID=A0AAN6T6I6_9PEZI|nr:hypothetical protein N658DRAFT_6659 [Parathielavia hyrcaniae]
MGPGLTWLPSPFWKDPDGQIGRFEQPQPIWRAWWQLAARQRHNPYPYHGSHVRWMHVSACSATSRLEHARTDGRSRKQRRAAEVRWGLACSAQVRHACPFACMLRRNRSEHIVQYLASSSGQQHKHMRHCTEIGQVHHRDHIHGIAAFGAKEGRAAAQAVFFRRIHPMTQKSSFLRFTVRPQPAQAGGRQYQPFFATRAPSVRFLDSFDDTLMSHQSRNHISLTETLRNP